MKTIADRARTDAKWAALGVAVAAYLSWKVSAPLLLAFSLSLLVQAVLLWRRQRAGVYFMVMNSVVILAWFAWLIFTKGASTPRVLICIGMAASLLGYWHHYRDLLAGRATWQDADDEDDRLPARTAVGYAAGEDRDRGGNDTSEDEEEEDPQPLTSIVLLRSKTKLLDDKILLEAMRDAWDPARKLGEEEFFAAGNDPLFIVKNLQGMWMVHNHPAPYFDDGSVTDKIPDLRLRKAVKEHSAWLSVDLMHAFDESLPVDTFYPYIFALIRELADEDTLAILRPETGSINIWNEEVAATLGSAEPLEEFGTPVAPVIQVSGHDPRMMAAIAEAREKFPVFREHWTARQDGDSFLAKASVTREGDGEIIWLEVIGVEPEFIHGTLANQPMNLEGLKQGDLVEVPLEDLYDWAIALKGSDEPLGIFTEKVVREVEREGWQALKGGKKS